MSLRQYLKQLLHQTTPLPTDGMVLFDKLGRPYQVFSNFNLYEIVLIPLPRPKRVPYAGRALVLWTLPTIKLADLSFLPAYQGFGLGTMLLYQLILLAQREGATSIYGRVVERDLAEKPLLRDWYRRFGFRFDAAMSYFMRLDLTNPQQPWLGVSTGSTLLPFPPLLHNDSDSAER